MSQPSNSAAATASASLEDPLAEAERILIAAREAGIPLRAAGGVGIALICASARRTPLSRRYQDIDFVARGRDFDRIERVFEGLGYEPEAEFNVIHGQRRLFFLDVDRQRQADIFLDRIEMCHQLDLRDRLDVRPESLAPADLLLSKLQVVETNQKDYTDTLAIVTDHELTDDDRGISLTRVTDVCASDWGWWRTVTMVAERTREFAEMWEERHGESHRGASDRLLDLLAALDKAPKSRRWKLRARVGDRVRWHQDPEDVDHDA
jgi:hypothetical protein